MLGVQQGFHHLSAQALTLQIGGHHHIPENGPEDAIAAGSPEGHHALSFPDADDGRAAVQRLPEVAECAAAGPEGVLIEQDAELVEDLEIDFNVRLPKSIQDGKTVDEVRSVILAMQEKLDTARNLLKEAEKSRKKVF